MLYWFFVALFRMLFKTVYRWQIIGLDNVPQHGGVILCSNHIHNLDPPLVGSAIGRQVFFMAKEELFRVPVLSFFLVRFGTFPVKRGHADKTALKRSLQVLKEGNILGIFPEGTRSKTGRLGEPLPGAAMFALKSDATVIPVAIIGPYKVFTPIRVVYGKPVDLTSFRENKVTSATTEEASRLIMSDIQKLIDQYAI